MNQRHHAGGTDAWWIRGRDERSPRTRASQRGLGSNVILLAVELSLGIGLAACGPASFPGREGFTDSGFAVDTGTDTLASTDTGIVETETETETGDPECAELINTGNVAIADAEILDLIDGVTMIDGDVEITGELAGVGLDALRCLEEVTGYVYVHDVDLADFTGLERLRRIGGYFYVGQTFALRDLTGLESLHQIGEYLHLTENVGLASTLGTDSLVDVGTFIFIDDNPALQDLDGLAKLPGTNGLLRIDGNASLTNLDGLSNMIGIRGDLGIVNNPSLTFTGGLSNIRVVAGSVLWQNNPQVFTLDLDSLETIDGYLVISNMPSLENLDDLFGLIGINNQLYIWESGMENIDGLADLEFVGGDVWIENNPGLTNLEGLSSLRSAFGTVRIDQNPALFDASGLRNLEIVSRGLSLWGNQNLAVVDLSNLGVVGEYVRVGYSALDQVSAPQLSTIGGDLLVFDNPQIQSFAGFDSLAVLGGNLDFRGNPSLTNLDFPALSQVFGRVQIIDNDALIHLGGLASVQQVQTINVRENASLTSVSGLSNVTQIPGFFKLVDNPSLVQIAGMNFLVEVGGEFELRDNVNLATIPGLQALDAVGSNLSITGNVDLPTCTAQTFAGGLSFVGGGVTISGNLADSCGG